MKDVIKEIKNAEGKTIEYQYLNDKFVPSFYNEIYHEVIIKKIKRLYFNAIDILQIKDDKIYNELSNLKTYNTHSFRDFYYHLLSLYNKDSDIAQDKLPIEFDIELLKKLYYQTSFYKFDRYSQKFSTDRNDYEEIIYYNRLFQGIAIHSFLDICFDKMFQEFPATVKDMAEILVFFEDNNKLNKERFKEINEKIIGCLDYVFEDNFYYNNEDNSRKIDIFKTLNKYKKFEYV